MICYDQFPQVGPIPPCLRVLRGTAVFVAAIGRSFSESSQSPTDIANPYANACFRSRFRGILIEIRNDGYIPYRGYVPLPAAEGDVADLGVIALTPGVDVEE